jgi:polyisoprenoid-binding protein YceI
VTLVRYAVEPGLSRFTVRAFATGLFSSLGHNPTIAIRDFSGEAAIPEDGLEGGSLHLNIDSRSLAVTDEVSEIDRRQMELVMNQEVLETARYPEIVFAAKAISGTRSDGGPFMANLAGDLSLHGVTHTQSVPVRVMLNGETLRAQGEFSVRQTTYGIKLVSVAGGSLKVKDELKCSFDIVARKKEA